MKFIKIIEPGTPARTIIINPDHIVSIVRAGDMTVVTMVNDEKWYTKEEAISIAGKLSTVPVE